MSDDFQPSRFLSADRPIASKDADLLGRASFAGTLASAIANWDQAESLVVSLNGPWGTGKSSIKNMVLEELTGVTPHKPTIVEFNPWQWAGHDQLAAAFFEEIAIGLGKADQTRSGRKRAARWRLYAQRLQVGRASLRSAQLVAGLVVGLLGFVGLAGTVQWPWVSVVVRVVGLAAIALGVLLAAGYGVVEQVAKLFDAQTDAGERTLPEIKSDLGSLLAELPGPVVVVIDDIDRLTPDQVRLLFQLVKANADFPKIVYVLLFQRSVVESALASESYTGREYLEKVVQANFDVPVVERTRLERVLFTSLDEVLSAPGVEERFTQSRWTDLYMSGLRNYFSTLRDVYRFVAAFAFHVGQFQTPTSFEVDPVDLIGIETLRMFEPDVYELLPSLKVVLTRADSGFSLGNARQAQAEADKAQADETLKVSRNPEAARAILQGLFPSAGRALGASMSYGSEFAGWYRESRVCHPDVFDRYFLLGLSEGEISHAEMQRVASHAGDRAALAADFRDVAESGRLEVLLNRLESYTEVVGLEHAVPFMTTLLDFGDGLNEGPRSMFSIEPSMHLSRIIHHYLEREPDVSKRGLLLQQAIEQSTGIYGPVRVVSLEDSEERERHPEYFIISEGDVPRLRELCVTRIREAASDGRLRGHPQLLYILYRWREWGDEGEARAWVESQTTATNDLLGLLPVFVGEVRSSGMSSYAVNVRYRINLEELAEFIDPDDALRRLSDVDVTSLPELEARGVTALRRAADLKARGIHPDSFEARFGD